LVIETAIARYWHACGDVEALIVTPLGLAVGVHIAERLHIPLIRAHTLPFASTQYDWAGRRNLRTAARGALMSFLGAGSRFVIWSNLRHAMNAARREVLALPPLPWEEPFSAMDRQRIPVLDAYSRAVVPRPPDWGPWVHVTGYWFLDDAPGWVPPAELTHFLESGPRPVFVGFGSTPFPDPGAATETVVRALTGAGHRGVIVAGGSGLVTGRLTDDILSVDFVPHHWLFPRVCAAVHHGGAGVTGAALRAGLPSVVVPVFADQPFWAARVFALGAGPRPIPAKRLTADALAIAIRLTSDQEMRQRAVALGKQIALENGVARAVDAIHDHLRALPEARRAS
jgi:UDP:flavonoid glycosyltransferase YjiC (YdhE family)